MHQIEHELVIPFFDLDPMQVVWHGHYVKYFELARCDLLQQIGYDYQQMSDSGYAWPVVDLRIQYVKPLRMGQVIRVQARLRDWEYRLKIDYVISDANSGERVTKGYTTQVAVDLESEEMCLESPQALKTSLGIT